MLRTVLPSSYSRHHATTANHLCASTPPPPHNLPNNPHQNNKLSKMFILKGTPAFCNKSIPIQPLRCHWRSCCSILRCSFPFLTKKFCRKTSKKEKKHRSQTNTHHRHLLPSSSHHYRVSSPSPWTTFSCVPTCTTIATIATKTSVTFSRHRTRVIRRVNCLVGPRVWPVIHWHSTHYHFCKKRIVINPYCTGRCTMLHHRLPYHHHHHHHHHRDHHCGVTWDNNNNIVMRTRCRGERRWETKGCNPSTMNNSNCTIMIIRMAMWKFWIIKPIIMITIVINLLYCIRTIILTITTIVRNELHNLVHQQSLSPVPITTTTIATIVWIIR